MSLYSMPCDACQAHIQYDHLTLDISGGYDHFIDNYQSELTLTLCHNCVLLMVAMFPAMGEKLGKGCHPCDTEVPCCSFAWKTADSECLVPADDLQSWVPLHT